MSQNRKLANIISPSFKAALKSNNMREKLEKVHAEIQETV